MAVHCSNYRGLFFTFNSSWLDLLTSPALAVFVWAVCDRVTVGWFVLHLGVKKKALATFSRAALTDRCLAGRYVSSLRNDMSFPCSKWPFVFMCCFFFIFNCSLWAMGI